MIRILFLLVLFFSSMSLLHAQPIDSAGTRRSGNIVVTVREIYRSAKLPVDSAIVTVVNRKDSSLSKAGVTNSNGVITFRVPKGRYLVSVSKENYSSNGVISSKTGSAENETNQKPVSSYTHIKVRRGKTVTLEPILKREKKKKKEVRLIPVKDE